MEATSSAADDVQSAQDSQDNQGSHGAYVLRDLIRDVPLSEHGDDKDVYITCVEAWEGNLYIGTSDAQILHFVSIPPDPSSGSDLPEYILASRNEPTYVAPQTSSYKVPGVEQILILPHVSKACILCNGTLTFYTLPELSPAFGGKIKQSDCTWIGGLDLNVIEEEQDPDEGAVIVICLKSRLRLIRIGEKAHKIRDIEVGGVLDLQRRDNLACVADGNSYALLDVVNQRKIDLFPVSSVSETPRSRSNSPTGPPPKIDRPLARSASARNPHRPPHLRGHERISSLGSAPKNTDLLTPNSPSFPARTSSRAAAPPSPTRSARSVSPGVDLDDKPLPQPPARVPSPGKQTTSSKPLSPHISSPTPDEFLLTTGTSQHDPGVGMFVNLDGDVVRGTIDFASYPDSLILHGRGVDPSNPPTPGNAPEEGYVLAIVRRNGERVIEYQRWDVDPGESRHVKGWLSLPNFDADRDPATFSVGLRHAATGINLTVSDIKSALSLRRLDLGADNNTNLEADAKRVKDEDQLISQFANVEAKVLLYARDRVTWVVRNPLVVMLESQLRASRKTTGQTFSVARIQVQKVINSIRGLEATNEFEFLGFNYIRQQASLLLLIDLILTTQDGVTASKQDKRSTLDALVTGEIDPRIILSIIPVLKDEIVQGDHGIWIPGGLRSTIEAFHTAVDLDSIQLDARGSFGSNLLSVIKEYLTVWRSKKGFGSISDEAAVFHTVDAALLHLLLLLDQHTSRGPARTGSIRVELNDVVDHGVECFDRAIELLEQYKRLYILSRLYQNKKQLSQVLSTWRRIVEGEEDLGGEMLDGEQDVRRYLVKIKNAALVKEYGAWLANRNPELGVQVFADENARVKFSPAEAVDLLKERAPGAVKDYLEHLVFGKNHIIYVNDLIAFYLDTVLDSISSDENARALLTDSYSTYRALTPPKPTYRAFITDNAPALPWWSNRLRLLQLIGGSHDAANRYDVDALATRLAPYSDVLVPEMIILSGRRGEHVSALRLLVHGLGDYDTAIRYCLLGGSSIFNPTSGTAAPAIDLRLPEKEEQELLFRHLLHEFFALENEDEKVERVAELLEKFGSFFELADVLALIPPDWPIQKLEDFLKTGLRTMIRERNESVVVKALAGAQNLRVAGGLVEKIEGLGPVWESVKKDSGIA